MAEDKEKRNESKGRRSTDNKTKDSGDKGSAGSKDKRKKQIIVGGSVFVVIVGLAIWYKDKSSSASTATTAGATTGTTGQAGYDNGSDWGGGGSGSGSGGGSGSGSGSGGGGGTGTSPSGGSLPIVATAGPGYDSAVSAALTKAKAALAKATKSGNKAA